MDKKLPSSKRYPPELKERAVKMVLDLQHQDPGVSSLGAPTLLEEDHVSHHQHSRPPHGLPDTGDFVGVRRWVPHLYRPRWIQHLESSWCVQSWLLSVSLNQSPSPCPRGCWSCWEPAIQLHPRGYMHQTWVTRYTAPSPPPDSLIPFPPVLCPRRVSRCSPLPHDEEAINLQPWRSHLCRPQEGGPRYGRDPQVREE
jgi:hypothetical protein